MSTFAKQWHYEIQQYGISPTNPTWPESYLFYRYYKVETTQYYIEKLLLYIDSKK